MDRETLTSAFAALWTDMAKAYEIGKQYVDLKHQAEERLAYIIDAIFSADEIDHAALNDIMGEAVQLAGLTPDHRVVQVIESELNRIEHERKAAAIRANAANN